MFLKHVLGFLGFEIFLGFRVFRVLGLRILGLRAFRVLG
jgi:hypothetical protein